MKRLSVKGESRRRERPLIFIGRRLADTFNISQSALGVHCCATAVRVMDDVSMPPLVLASFFFAALAGFNFGFDIGATGGAVTQLRASPGAGALDASPLYRGLLTSGSLFGAVVGTALSFLAADPLGRRGELLLGAALYLVGTAVTCFAPPATDQMLSIVFVGRRMASDGSPCCSRYIAETSTPLAAASSSP